MSDQSEGGCAAVGLGVAGARAGGWRAGGGHGRPAGGGHRKVERTGTGCTLVTPARGWIRPSGWASSPAPS